MKMLAGLQEEIAKYPTLLGASNKIVKDYLNSTASNPEILISSSEKINISKADLLAELSDVSKVAVFNFKEADTDASKAFKLLFEATNTFTVTHVETISKITALSTAGLITDTERDTILELGKRLQTIAETVFGRALTMEDFE